MAEVVSVSVPGELHKRWKSSGKQISPSTLFQTALETELDNTNRHLVYSSILTTSVTIFSESLLTSSV